MNTRNAHLGNSKTLILLLVPLFFLLAGLLRAEAAPVDPRALSMGGAYTTLAKGSEALHWNPANLRANPVRFELSLPTAGGVSVNNSYFSINRLLLEPKNYASGEDFLADIAGGRLQGQIDGGLHAGIVIGRLAASTRAEITLTSKASADATRLVTVGTEPNTTYRFDGTQLESFGLISAGGGLAFALPGRTSSNGDEPFITVGVNAKTYRGLFFAEATVDGTIDVSEHSDYTADLVVKARNTDVEAVYDSDSVDLSSLPGQGYGFDVGVTARPNSKLTIGASITNLISSMTWTDITEREGTLKGALASSGSDGPDLPDDFDDLTTTSRVDGQSIERRLPMEARFGMSYRLLPQVLLAADVSKRIIDQGIERPMSIHLGTELTPFANARFGKRFALRLGYEHSGSESWYSYGVGLAFTVWEFDIGMRVANSFVPVDAQGTALAFSSRIRF